MIKAKVDNYQVVQISELESKDFPVIGITDTGTIVLFTGQNTGTRIYSRHDTIGYWCNAWNAEQFTVFNGKVEVRNEED